MKYIFIINAIAGNGKYKKILPNIENICKERNIEYEIRYITERQNMEFTLFRIDPWSDIFLIIKEDNKELPLVVYGMLKVEGKSYKKAFCSLNSISDELMGKEELDKLQEQAMCTYFNVD